MCALRINELGQHSSEILLLRRHAEHYASCAHVAVESLHVSNSKPQLDSPGWILSRSRMQREDSLTSYELTPPRRLELESETQHIAVERHGFAHVRHELDHIPKLRSLHFAPLLDGLLLFITIWCGGQSGRLEGTCWK